MMADRQMFENVITAFWLTFLQCSRDIMNVEQIVSSSAAEDRFHVSVTHHVKALQVGTELLPMD